MSVCTKFKIHLFSSRYQSFTSKNDKKNLTTKGTDKEEPNINSPKKEKNEIDFASGANAQYMEYLFSKWIKDYNSVHRSWHVYFSELGANSEIKTSNNTNKEQPALHSSEMADPVKLFAKLDEVAAPKPAEGALKIESQDSNEKENESPGSETVIGHIILTPRSDDIISEQDSAKPIGINNLIANISEKSKQAAINDNDKASNVKDKPEKSVEQEEYLRAIKLIKRGLEHKAFNEMRDAINTQLQIINMQRLQKTLERLKVKANDKDVNKNSKTTK